MFSQTHILAAVFGLLSSIGWILQAAGGGLLYKKVWDYKNNNADITFQEVCFPLPLLPVLLQFLFDPTDLFRLKAYC